MAAALRDGAPRAAGGLHLRRPDPGEVPGDAPGPAALGLPLRPL